MPPAASQLHPEEQRARSLSRISRVASLLDARFAVPGTRFRIGVDGLVGLLPGVGDTIGTLLSLYLLAEGWRLEVRRLTLLKMLGNVALDTVVGTIPLLGDVFDIAWKANLRNARLIEEDLRSRPG